MSPAGLPRVAALGPRGTRAPSSRSAVRAGAVGRRSRRAVERLEPVRDRVGLAAQGELERRLVGSPARRQRRRRGRASRRAGPRRSPGGQPSNGSTRAGRRGPGSAAARRGTARRPGARCARQELARDLRAARRPRPATPTRPARSPRRRGRAASARAAPAPTRPRAAPPPPGRRAAPATARARARCRRKDPGVVARGLDQRAQPRLRRVPVAAPQQQQAAVDLEVVGVRPEAALAREGQPFAHACARARRAAQRAAAARPGSVAARESPRGARRRWASAMLLRIVSSPASASPASTRAIAR